MCFLSLGDTEGADRIQILLVQKMKMVEVRNHHLTEKWGRMTLKRIRREKRRTAKSYSKAYDSDCVNSWKSIVRKLSPKLKFDFDEYTYSNLIFVCSLTVLSLRVLFFVATIKKLLATEEGSHKNGFMTSKARPYEYESFC